MSRRFRDPATGEWKDADPVFVPIIVWGEAAQRCQGRVNKGAPVFVEGRLQTSKWTDKETGNPRSRLEVVASRVQFLTIRSAQDFASAPQSSEPAAIGAKASEEASDYQNNQQQPPAKQSFADDDEDIPF
jgi:single-strand DNA-binding protein